MSGVWYGRCEGCFEQHDLVTVKLGTGGFTPALCVECEARLRLISADYDRLRYTIGQLLKKVPMECLTGDLPQSAVEKISRVVAFARSTWKADLASKRENEHAIDVNLTVSEPVIANDLMQRIRTQLQNPNCLSPDYSMYSVRQEDKFALHGVGISWDPDDEKLLPTRPSEEQCESLRTSTIAASRLTTPKLFGKF